MRRVHGRIVLAGIFGFALAVAAFVASQLPRKGERAALPPVNAPAPEPERSPAQEPAFTERDGILEVVASAGGAPQPDAAVALYLRTPEGFRLAGRGVTGPDGRVRLPAGPGLYHVAARAPGLAAGHAEGLRAPDEEGARVEVALAPPAALEGRVRARGSGAGVGARIVAVPLVNPSPAAMELDAPPEERAVVRADSAGAFRLEGLAPGAWALRVSADGHHPAVLARVAVPHPGPLAVELEILGGIAGRVLRPDGRPAAGAEVRAASRNHGASVVSDVKGRFTLGVPAGRYAVLAALSGAAAAAPSPVDVAAGAVTPGLELALGTAAEVEGAVVDAAGAPRPGAAVELLAHGTGEVIARATAGADGRFRVAGLAPAPYDLRASAPGATPAFLPGLSPRPGEPFPARVTLAGLGGVAGRVIDPAGRPLAGVHVRLVSRGDGLAGLAPRELRSGFDGRFRFEGVEAGRAEVVAHEPEAALGAGRAVRVVPGAESAAELVLPGAGWLEGKVSAGGPVAPGATAVVAAPLRAAPGVARAARAEVDASGNFRVALPAGEYRVHAAPAGATGTDLRVAPAFVRVEPSRTVRVLLPPAAPADEGGAAVRVLEPGGAPSPGAVVTFTRPGDDRVALATSAGEDGRVALGADMGLAGREVAIQARSGGRAGAFTGALPASGEVTVRLAPAAALEGEVVARGEVAGLTVEVTPLSGPGPRPPDVHRFSGARFALADVPAGAVRVLVRTDDGRAATADLTLAAGEVGRVSLPLGPPVVPVSAPAGR
jgi:protocatechuate 3,4-dioxygenase beta subunit